MSLAPSGSEKYNERECKVRPVASRLVRPDFMIFNPIDVHMQHPTLGEHTAIVRLISTGEGQSPLLR